MLEIMRGKEDWEFLRLTNDNLIEVMDYLASHPHHTKLRIDFTKCSKVINELGTEKNIRYLKAVHFESDGYKQLELFENLRDLESISFGYDKSEFNFSELRNLNSIGGIWSSKWIGLEKCHELKSFSVSKFKDSFSSIPNLEKLETIRLIQSSITNIYGIQGAVKLKTLELLLMRFFIQNAHRFHRR